MVQEFSKFDAKSCLHIAAAAPFAWSPPRTMMIGTGSKKYKQDRLFLPK